MYKCLVTGGAGFIGHHLVRRLLEDGHEVTVVDDLSTGQLQRMLGFKKMVKDFHAMDVTDYCDGFIDDINFDFVFHLAALPRVPVSFEKPLEVLRNNVNATLSALEICRVTEAKMIYSSSSSIYGDQEDFPIYEDCPKNIQSPYALSKWIGEELCETYERDFGVKYVALRYFNVYGSGMTEGGYATAIKTFLDEKSNGHKLTVTGTGEQERDFTHVDDVVEANILAMREGVTGPMNIGAGEPKKILDVAKLIDPEGDIDFIPARKEPLKTHASVLMAYEKMGWRPTKNFEEEIKKLVEKHGQRKTV